MSLPLGNLKAKYDFNNPACYSGSGATVYDLSGNGITLAIQTGGTFITGDINYFQLDGITRLDSGSNANIPTNTNITMNVWVRPSFINAPSSYGNWFSLGLDGSGTIPFIGASGGGTAGVYGDNNTVFSGGFGVGTVATTASIYTDETQWYFMQAVSSSSTGTSFYINGNLIGANASLVHNLHPYLRIGAYDTTFYNGWGDVAYASFYNTALTQAQLLEEFNSTRSAYQVPVSQLDLSNPASFSGSGLTVYDLSGNNNDFYFSGSGYTYSTVTGGEVTYNSFDTVLFRPTPVFNDYTFGTTPFSMHVWCKLLANGGLNLSQMWCGNFTGGAGISHNNPFLFANANSSNNEITFTDGTELAGLGTSVIIGEWNLYSVVKPANAGVAGVQVYLNGNLLTNPNTNNDAINVSQATITGQLQSRMAVAGTAHTAASQGNVYNGIWTLGEFQFFNTAIGASQVQDFYANTESRYNPPVPAVLSFEINAANPASYSGSGTTVYDLSPAARIGNLDSSTFGSSTWSPNFGGIFTLDGYNDIFEFAGGGVAVSQPGSISVWFRSNAPYNAGNVVSQGSYATNGWGLNLGQAYSTNPNILSLVSHGVGYRSSGVGVTVGEWAFVSLNYNVDGTSNLFINGGIGATMAAIGMSPPQQLIRIGYDGGGPAQPEIDVAQVYMYDGAITLAEHITLYNATKSPFVPAPPIPIQNSNVGGRSFNKGLNG
jgi:hypothetical protein